MIKFYLFHFLTFVFFSTSLAQSKKDVTYFDRDWMPVKNKNEAAYYRTVEKSGNKYLVKDLYLEND